MKRLYVWTALYCLMTGCCLGTEPQKESVRLPAVLKVDRLAEEKNPVRIALTEWLESMTGLPVYSPQEQGDHSFFTVRFPPVPSPGIRPYASGAEMSAREQEYLYKLVSEAKVRYDGIWCSGVIDLLDYSTSPSMNPATGALYYETSFFVSDSSTMWVHYQGTKHDKVCVSNPSTRVTEEVRPLRWKIQGDVARIPLIMADVDFSVGPKTERLAVVSELVLVRHFLVRLYDYQFSYNSAANVSVLDQSIFVLPTDYLIGGNGVYILGFIYSFRPFQ